jgi:hypothetical protein
MVTVKAILSVLVYVAFVIALGVIGALTTRREGVEIDADDDL